MEEILEKEVMNGILKIKLEFMELMNRNRWQKILEREAE